MRKKSDLEKLHDIIKEADVVLEIVDARDPENTRLEIAEKWAGSNRLVVIANKCDLVADDPAEPPPRGIHLFVTAHPPNPKTRKIILAALRKRARKLPARGVVVGYPNVGKSSIINLLAEKGAAKVSPIAGTTTNVQWINVTPDIMISDYPGVFPRYEKKAELVRKGALNVSGDAETYAYGEAERILGSKKLRVLATKYFDISLEGLSSGEELLSLIAKRRGWLLKGGEPSIAQASQALLRAMKEAPEI